MIIGIVVFAAFVAVVLVLAARAHRRNVAIEREISLRCQAIADMDGHRRAEHIVNELWTTPTHARPGRSSLDMAEDDVGAVLTTTCTKCGGTGTLTLGVEQSLCARCDGSGFAKMDITPWQQSFDRCHACDGLGWQIHGDTLIDCTWCDGTGTDTRW